MIGFGDVFFGSKAFMKWLECGANISNKTALFVIDATDQQFVYINDAFAGFLGYSRLELFGQCPSDLRMWDDDDNARDIVEHVLQHGSLSGFEARLRLRSGELRSLSLSAMLVEDELRNQLVFGYFAPVPHSIRPHFHSDLSRFKAAFSSMAEAVLIIDDAGIPVDVNETFMRMHDCKTRQEAIDLLAHYPERYEAYDEHGKAVALEEWPLFKVMKGESGLNWECSLVNKETKERRFYRFNYGPLFDSDGSVAGGVISSIDISDTKAVTERLSSLEHTLQTTLMAVSRMAEQRDPYTAGHQRRVGIIASDIARKLGFPPKRCQDLQYIGMVHDVGKVGVPAEILSKPEHLTAIEFALVQTHVEKGCEIMKDVNFPLPIAEIILQHHERLDGTGYPHGLKGDEILFEARILAVADVVESMANHRPYRPALGLEAALQEIEEHRGTRYDRVVVDALIDMIRTDQYQIPN